MADWAHHWATAIARTRYRRPPHSLAQRVQRPLCHQPPFYAPKMRIKHSSRAQAGFMRAGNKDHQRDMLWVGLCQEQSTGGFPAQPPPEAPRAPRAEAADEDASERTPTWEPTPKRSLSHTLNTRWDGQLARETDGWQRMIWFTTKLMPQ